MLYNMPVSGPICLQNVEVGVTTSESDGDNDKNNNSNNNNDDNGHIVMVRQPCAMLVVQAACIFNNCTICCGELKQWLCSQTIV
jgi:hypothetical protein